MSQGGGTLRIYSTPNGLRDTTYYRLTCSTVPSVPLALLVEPIWNEEREAELEEFYGGKDSAGCSTRWPASTASPPTVPSTSST